MSLKSKKPKYRRRGDRLIVTYPNGQRYLYAPHGQRRRIVELSRPGEQYAVTYSETGRFALWNGNCELGPTQLVRDGEAFGKIIAIRGANDHAWMFVEDEKKAGGSRFVSISHAGIANAALLASAHIGEINEEPAAFLDVSRVLYRAEDVVEIRDSPRYAALRNFKFRFEPRKSRSAAAAAPRTPSAIATQTTTTCWLLPAACCGLKFMNGSAPGPIA